MPWASCTLCLLTTPNPQILVGKVQDPAEGDSTLLRANSASTCIGKCTVQKANSKTKFREITTQEEVAKNVKTDSSQCDTAIKDNDRQSAQVATKEILTVFKAKCSPEHGDCCPERLANHHPWR